MHVRHETFARWLAGLQGLYYVASGAWPVLHMQSFLTVTGPKTDLWLVEAFGLLIAAFGLVLGYASLTRRVSSLLELAALALAATLAFIDVYYVAHGNIRRIYLADALVEALIALGWMLLRARALRPLLRKLNRTFG